MSEALEIRKCPGCRGPMEPHQFEDLRLDLCPRCASVWYDAGEFTQMVSEGPSAVDALVSSREAATDQLAERHGGDCPKCGIPLHRNRYKGMDIFLETCYECGGILISWEDLKRLDAVAHEHPDLSQMPNASPEVLATGGQLDAATANNLFRARLAQYRWQQTMHPINYL
ncbi:MAG TPA: zf-TFIIB domain-containing protein [Fimbriimonas sp.]|nr:zf-TFIIB domain-containing protein [Fimbriimonas sp.]